MRLGFKVGFVTVLLIVLTLRLLANTNLATGSVGGYVFNYYGLAISGAVVGIENGPVTTSGDDGFFILENISSGEQAVGCGKAGYNTMWANVTVIPVDTVFHNFTLTQPAMLINPLLIDETINPGEYLTTPVSLLNNGTGLLNWQASVNYLSMPVIPCQYSIALFDTWGDGWNGCSMDVLINDSVVLDNITLNSGSGPAYYFFTVISGDQVTTDFNPGPFNTEPYYYLYNGVSEQVWYSPAGSNGPPDVLPGQLFAACAGGEWLTMDYYEGEVPPFGGVGNVPVHLNATATLSGESYNADIIFTSTPFVGDITIPVTMNVMGNEILAPGNFTVELVDAVEGKVELNWDWVGDSFQFFVIKRDGAIIATTSSLTYIDILTGHGIFCYTVQAFYNEGPSVPVGPECVEWPDPVLNVDPDEIEAWVWSGFTVDAFTTISNLGEGTLSYSFPEFVALDLLNNPGERDVTGAGGPDNFGYIWIDSDETGGPAFDYTDISATGTPVFGLSDDNIVGPFKIGFDFYFYGEVKSLFWINSNGCIGFTSNKITNGNTAIPTNSWVYNDFIAWMWDDLVYRPGFSQVFYKSFHDKLIIQFKNYEHWGQQNMPINAEVVIYKNGKILLLYDYFAQGVTLNSCTVGLQSSSPELGLQVAFNTTYLHSDLAVLLKVPGDFITDVDPPYGVIPENGSQVITITYDSEDNVPGPYTQELILESNDLNHPEYIIENTMHIYSPAIFAGNVYDRDDEEPVNGVLVTAGPYQATTGEDGGYTLYVDEGSYDVIFEKLGYMTVTIEDTMAFRDEITPVDLGLWDKNYSPSFLHAEVMANDTWCQLTWGLPQGPYEIIMDDGEANDFFVYTHNGSWNAVKFTPSGYPATVIGGSFNVGDGSFPGPFLGTEFGVAVFDDDGVNGLPGTMLDSNGVTVNNSGWVNLDWMNAVVHDGSFYLAMYQAGNVPHAAPIGVDTDNPTHFRSYSKFQSGSWSLSPLQDFMIRAWINGPEGDGITEKAGRYLKAVPRIPENWSRFGMTRSGILPDIKPGFESNDVLYKGIFEKSYRNVVNYRVAWYSDFDLDDPFAGGDFIDIANTENLYYNDYGWGGRPQGWYAYAVKALYTSGEYSAYAISNIVGHWMDCQATFNISLTTGLEPDNVQIVMQGLDYPYEAYSGNTASNGTAVFDMVWKGHYHIIIKKIGYDIYEIENVNINDDKIFNIVLSEKKYPPTCLYVDPVSLQATWCYPLITSLEEDFEDPEFPPPGWQSLATCDTTGWIRTNDGSNSSWIIPPWDSYYAAHLDDFSGSDCNACCEYLITPPVDLRESEDFSLSFDSYYDGAYGQLAFVEYSFDEGATWEVLYQVMPAMEWTRLEIDLGAFGGPESPEQMWFALHSEDAGSWASGWAVDNLSINVPSSPALFQDFSVFLDDAYVGQTAATNWNFSPLAYGQTYTASVAAHYSSGMSAKDYYTFECKYLFPPQNLVGSAPDNASILSWDPPGSSIVPYNLYGYIIYRNDIFVSYIPHNGEWEPQGYIDQDLQPGIYSYSITGVYDLEPYGLPGETGESMKEGPKIVTVDYCTDLEFVETWDLGSFGVNNWISDGPNWSVNGQTGNPAPVAEFSGSPVQNDYEISLESYPICVLGLTEGEIWLDFDLAMYAYQFTGGECLQVQVWGWDSHEWSTVSEYCNNVENYSWTSKRIDISPLALDKIIKIRFKAKGAFSADMRGWFIDNIHIYRTCIAPENLSIDPDYYEGIRLTWLFPQSGNKGSENGTRELAGYLIYRSIDGGNYELLTDTYTSMPYIDPDSNLAMGSFYCYRVSAVYSSETDQCISDLSNEACAVWTNIDKNIEQKTGIINLYPVPANDHLFISSSEEIKQISVYNAIGELMFGKSFSVNQLEINTSGYPAGTYVVRIETRTGINSRVFSIQR